MDVKFCGMTREQDIQAAVELGAQYVGFIFAGGPRNLTVERAQELVAATPTFVKKVGVFRTNSPDQISSITDKVALDVIQLHSDPTPSDISRIEKIFDGEVWPVVRIEGSELPQGTAELFDTASVVVLDAKVRGMLGGTGQTLPWKELADQVSKLRKGKAKLSLAGGLTPENVSEAASILQPDIIDVSSGIESSPGVKSYEKMKQFVEQVNNANVSIR